MTGLDDKVVIITGAGSGLGREYALAVARAGATVVVNDIDPNAADATVALITAEAGKALAVPGSVSSWSDTERLVAATLTAFGRLDGLVANAAIMHMTEPWNEEEARLRAIAEVNILGVQFCVRHALRAMVDAGAGGAIVTVVSGAQHGILGMSAYGASKGAVTAMTANWAVEGAPHGIRVNAISPWALTPMTLAHLDRSHADPATFPEPAAIAPLVVALLSDDLAGLTGRSIRFDGSRLSSYELSTAPIAEAADWTPASITSALRERFPTSS